MLLQIKKFVCFPVNTLRNSGFSNFRSVISGPGWLVPENNMEQNTFIFRSGFLSCFKTNFVSLFSRF